MPVFRKECRLTALWDWSTTIRRSFEPVPGITQARRGWIIVLSIAPAGNPVPSSELVSELNPKYTAGYQVLRS